MKKTKAYYLSEDIDPILWESVSDAYNDLAEYAYNRIEYLSSTYPIPAEYAGDAVLKACEKAFKYSYSYDETVGKRHNWFNLILKNAIHDIYKTLPKEQSLDKVLNKDIANNDSDAEAYDDLDIVISSFPALTIHIGFVHEFIQILCAGADIRRIADFINGLHELIDRAGEEIDSIIDIRR